MVEYLKRSVETLEAPTCPNCNIDLKWYRSDLLFADKRPEAVVHFFQCPNCNRMAEVRTKPDAAGDGSTPPLLSRPAHAFYCAV